MKLLLINMLLLFAGCFGGKPSAPAPTPRAPEEQDAAVIASRDNERLRRRGAAGKTLFTSPMGVVDPAPVQKKTLFGQ